MTAKVSDLMEALLSSQRRRNAAIYVEQGGPGRELVIIDGVEIDGAGDIVLRPRQKLIWHPGES